MATKYEIGTVTSGLLVESLYDQEITARGDYQLKHSIEGYTFIGVVACSSNTYSNTHIYPVEVLKFLNGAKLIHCYGYSNHATYHGITLVGDCLSVVNYESYPIAGIYGIR